MSLSGVITSQKWKETHTTEVMPETEFLQEWKRNIPLISQGWDTVSETPQRELILLPLVIMKGGKGISKIWDFKG